jgi:hypothetical protein
MSALLPPTLDSLSGLFATTSQKRADTSLRLLRREVGPVPDPTNGVHAEAIYLWLNKWGCRLGLQRHEPFAVSLTAWWDEWHSRLPVAERQLFELSDPEVGDLAAAYGDLRRRPAFVNRAGRARSIGPTAAAKILYVLRPDAVVAWDARVSRTAGGKDAKAYQRHLERARDWASALVEEGARRGFEWRDLPEALGRPGSTLAKIIDEYLYLTISRGHAAA